MENPGDLPEEIDTREKAAREKAHAEIEELLTEIEALTEGKVKERIIQIGNTITRSGKAVRLGIRDTLFLEEKGIKRDEHSDDPSECREVTLCAKDGSDITRIKFKFNYSKDTKDGLTHPDENSFIFEE
jgi:hypothetical protein